MAVTSFTVFIGTYCSYISCRDTVMFTMTLLYTAIIIFKEKYKNGILYMATYVVNNICKI